MKPKYLKVLEYLESGRSFILAGRQIVMSHESYLCISGQCSQRGNILLPLDVEFNTLIDWCNELSDSEIMTIVKLLAKSDFAG